MSHKITYTPTVQIEISASRQFMWRKTWFGLIIFPILILWGGCGLAATPIHWFTIGIITFTFTLLLYYLVGWLGYENRVRHFASLQKNRPISIYLNDEDLIIRTDENGPIEDYAYHLTYKWHTVRLVWRFKDVWLLFPLTNQNYVSIPTSELTDEIKQFIENQVTKVGGRLA